MNKKIVSLLMAAALITGMGGYGTLAHFIDEAQVNDKISITMGTLDVDAQFKDSNWNQRPDNKGYNESTIVDGNFTNVKPGEYFYRDITVKNLGTLDAQTTIKLNNLFDTNDVNVELSLLGNPKPTGITEVVKNKEYSTLFTETGAEYTFRLYIRINENMTAGQVEQVFNAKASEIVTVSAEQVRYYR